MKVLYIEDNHIQARTGIRAARNIGGELIIAETGGAAFEALKIHQFDVILCDLQLPDIDGIVLLRRLRAKLPTIPIIVLTGVTLPRHEETCLDAGGTEYLLKPITAEEVELVLRKYCTAASH